MPYCTQCGNQVTDEAIFCGSCGARQKEGGPTTAGASASTQTDPLASITPRTASLLCYIPLVGWVAAIVVLAAERFRNDRATRFNAWQGLYLFVAYLLVDWVIAPMIPGPDFVSRALRGVILAAWIFMIIKTSQDEVFHLPVVGELAERSVSEQR